MMKQYVTFGAVLMIAVLVLTSVEWDFPVQRNNESNIARAGLKHDAVNDEAKNIDISTDNRQISLQPTEVKSATSTQISAAASTQALNRQDSANPLSPKTDEQDLSHLPQASSNDVQMNPVSGSNPLGQSTQAPTGQVDTSLDNKAQTTPVPETLPDSDKAESTPNEASSDEETLPELFTDIQIKGHVLDDGGKLLSGIGLRLELLHASPDDTARFAQRKLTAQSNEQGVYAFTNLVEGDYRVCTMATAGYRQVCQQRRAPHLSADFSLTTLFNGRITGTVKNEQGRLLEGVTVAVTPGQNKKAITDEKGQYNLSVKVNEGTSYQLYLSKPGDYRRERTTLKGVEIQAGKVVDVTLRKLGGVDVRGVVRDQNSYPVDGVTVALHSASLKSNQSLYGVTNQNGEFLIQHVEPAKDYRVTSVSSKGSYAFDSGAYRQIEVFEGMPPLEIKIKKIGSAYFSARVATPDGKPLVGEVFMLHSGTTFGGQSTSDANGKIEFADAPADLKGSKLRISNRSAADPRFVFSGITLREGEYISDVPFVVDRGDNTLVVKVVDAAAPQNIIQGAQGILTWMFKRDGVTNQTSRLKGKKSREETGEIQFTELSLGAHQLRVTMPGYLPYSATVDINQYLQQYEVRLAKK